MPKGELARCSVLGWATEWATTDICQVLVAHEISGDHLEVVLADARGSMVVFLQSKGVTTFNSVEESILRKHWDRLPEFVGADVVQGWHQQGEDSQAQYACAGPEALPGKTRPVHENDKLGGAPPKWQGPPMGGRRDYGEGGGDGTDRDEDGDDDDDGGGYPGGHGDRDGGRQGAGRNGRGGGDSGRGAKADRRLEGLSEALKSWERVLRKPLESGQCLASPPGPNSELTMLRLGNRMGSHVEAGGGLPSLTFTGCVYLTHTISAEGEGRNAKARETFKVMEAPGLADDTSPERLEVGQPASLLQFSQYLVEQVTMVTEAMGAGLDAQRGSTCLRVLRDLAVEVDMIVTSMPGIDGVHSVSGDRHVTAWALLWQFLFIRIQHALLKGDPALVTRDLTKDWSMYRSLYDSPERSAWLLQFRVVLCYVGYSCNRCGRLNQTNAYCFYCSKDKHLTLRTATRNIAPAGYHADRESFDKGDGKFLKGATWASHFKARYPQYAAYTSRSSATAAIPDVALDVEDHWRLLESKQSLVKVPRGDSAITPMVQVYGAGI